MIKVTNLKKEFTREDKNKKKTKFFAVNGISFETREGEIIGILGPNGAGKTTLLRMLAGIMEQKQLSLGIDVGSTTVKVVLREGDTIYYEE